MKRGESGLSLIVGVDKPSGISSHDVVNRCRAIFQERRVGHMGTLDPLATGVLPICIGPATRLNAYLNEHDKRYRTTLVFGAETDTGDIQGAVIRTGHVCDDLLEGSFASAYIQGIVGSHMQIPPAYSAIKQQGVKAYERARAGEDVQLEPRPIEIYDAQLVDRFRDPITQSICWILDVRVSSGTYIRSLVRDIGRELGALAYVSALERTALGTLDLDSCISLDALQEKGIRAAIDPIRLLGIRFIYADAYAHAVQNGNPISTDTFDIFQLVDEHIVFERNCCMPDVCVSTTPLEDQEIVGIIIENRLKALYRYDQAKEQLRSACVFAEPIVRTYL